MPQHRFPVQVTTLPDCDDITRFDGGTVWIRMKMSLIHSTGIYLRKHRREFFDILEGGKRDRRRQQHGAREPEQSNLD